MTVAPACSSAALVGALAAARRVATPVIVTDRWVSPVAEVFGVGRVMEPQIVLCGANPASRRQSTVLMRGGKEPRSTLYNDQRGSLKSGAPQGRTIG